MTHESDTAKKIKALLEHGVLSMDMAIASRLAEARARAVAAASSRTSTQAGTLAGGVLRLASAHLYGWRVRLVSAALLATTAFALIMLQNENGMQQLPVETDTLLLASDLPPEAYIDQGFHAWLENSSLL